MRRSEATLIAFMVASYSFGACADPVRPPSSRSEIGVHSSAQTSEDAISDIAERTIVSVVNISSQKVLQTQHGAPDFGPFFNDPFFRHFFGPDRPGQGGRSRPRERRADSLGSGVIVDSSGTILTNNHVVENASEVRVTLSDGRSFEATIVGTDPESDIGVVRLKDPPDDLMPLPFGDSDKLRLGSTVLAIGNPFGVGQTVTMGIVSAKGRANVGIVDYEDFIQTDAAINPGNSGGALINMRGELVGINTAILSRSGGYQGIGFAIPSNMARRIMESLVDHGKVVRGWLGVMIQDLTPELASALSLPKGSTGALVSDVVDGSPAKAGGVETGDVVVGVNGVAIDSSSKLRNQVAAAGASKRVKLKVLRNGAHKSLEVKLGEREATKLATADERDEIPLGGLSLAPLDAELAARFGLPRDAQGIAVVGIDENSDAAAAGFRVGDLVLEVNRKRVSSARDFEKQYHAANDALAVLVQRGEGRLFLVLKKTQ